MLQRRFFPPFSLCGYSFSLLADPRGNPRATNQASAGAQRVEKGLSVYLTVLFQEDPPDTPPWGGGGIASNQGFPPPPLQLGPGHPWGAGEEEEEEEEREEEAKEEEQSEEQMGGHQRAGYGMLDVGQSGDSVARPAESGVSNDSGSGGGGADAAAEGDASATEAVRKTAVVRETATAAVKKRDPHGLRHRRRRARTREGRAPMVSHVGDASAMARECCAGFSLTAVNKDSRKDVTWMSSMKRDRFFPGRSSWGVHCLVPTSTFQVRCA